MQVLSGSLKEMSLELDGVSTLNLLTDRRKPLSVTVSKGHVTVSDDEFNSTLYEGQLIDSEIVLHPGTSYILFEGRVVGNVAAAYRLAFSLTARTFTFDARAIERVK